jgi:hypothetical protein
VARHGRAIPLPWRRPGLATFAQLAVTGTGSIGTNYPAIANQGIAGETTAAASGFGAPSLSGLGAVVPYHGTASVTTAAAALAGTGDQTFTGTGAFTTAASSLAGAAELTYAGTASVSGEAASLSGLADLVYSGTASWTSAAASLDISGILAYNGIAAVESAPAELAGSGSLSYAGTASLTTAAASLSGSGDVGAGIFGSAAFTAAAASLRGRGRRIRGAGHDVVDLARYEAFVSQGEAILEELGQTPQPTGATSPTLDAPPLLDPAAVVATAAATLPTLVTPSLAITGKAWVKGQGAPVADAPYLIGRGVTEWVATGHVWTTPAALAATGTLDNYYTIRQQDEALIEDFIRTHLLGTAA